MTYAPLTVSAVNHTAGTLTITNHGLVTGGGFAGAPLGPLWGGALYALEGGVIPTGLAPVTTYWPIVIDPNTIKLASSNANAMNGTAVSFSTDGTLPLQFLVGLPYEVPRTEAPGMQVFSDDLNNVWQSLKAMWAWVTHQQQTVFPTDKLIVPHAAPGFTGSAADQAALVPTGTSSPSGRHMPIHGLAVGRVITAVRARVADDGSTDKLIVLLTKYDPGTDGGTPNAAAADVSGTASSASAGSGLIETIEKTGLAVQVAPGIMYNVCVRKSNGTSATSRVLHCEIEAR